MQRITLLIWRSGQALCGRPGIPAFLLRRIVRVGDILWIRGLLGAELPSQVVCGPGVRIPHAARGVILHPSCVLGSNLVLYHHVTVGMTNTLPAPRVEDDVLIGTGARVLGPITVASRTKIGANAVVVRNTLPGHTYVGVPAAPVRHDR
ncbi:serine O-acetyltransferase [Austwickia chelonae]|nr:hypothetical protein [Austwickia chelonae]